MIKGIVNGQRLVISAKDIAGETIAKLTADFDFSPEWAGLTGVAYFTNGEVTYPFLLTDEGGITEEQNMNLSAGKWECFIWGFDLKGEEPVSIENLPENAVPRLTTTVASFIVKRTGEPGADPVEVKPASLGEQILSVAVSASDKVDDLERRADSGEFKGEKGDKGDPGEKGDGYTITEDDIEEIADRVKESIKIPVDEELDADSVNPVANKAIYAKMSEVEGKAQTANNIAGVAATKAENAYSLANTALAEASSASTAAQTAQSTASSASVTAGRAQTTANSAKTTAQTAQTTANSASTSASQAKTAASTAQTTADTAYALAEAKYTMPAGGIPENDLSAEVQSKLNSGGGGGTVPDDLILVGETPAASTHLLVNENGVEIVIPEMSDIPTEQTVSGWGFTKNSGTYSKPSTGIPEADLSAEVQTKLNSGGGGGISDVQVNGTSIVSVGVANIPYASANTHGVIKSGWFGFSVNADGRPNAGVMDETGWVGQANSYFIGKGTLNMVLSHPSLMPALTEAEQLAAQARLGILSSEGVSF